MPKTGKIPTLSFMELIRKAPIGRRIRIARQLRGWSVEKLSVLSIVSRTTIQNAEMSKDINSSSLMALSKTLGISLDELVDGPALVEE